MSVFTNAWIPCYCHLSVLHGMTFVTEVRSHCTVHSALGISVGYTEAELSLCARDNDECLCCIMPVAWYFPVFVLQGADHCLCCKVLTTDLRFTVMPTVWCTFLFTMMCDSHQCFQCKVLNSVMMQCIICRTIKLVCCAGADSVCEGRQQQHAKAEKTGRQAPITLAERCAPGHGQQVWPGRQHYYAKGLPSLT